ncbi:MAG: D-alanyl-D-alanine carboxypeptidase [Desulfobacterales bacterium]|nr:D-alanyl-D-alanine carboxypeptidase [Desulfobacterales bacterium]
MKKILVSVMVICFALSNTDVFAVQKNKSVKPIASKAISKDPYIGAIVIDAATGNVLFEDNADTKGHPASIIKLMTLLIVLESLKAKTIALEDKVITTAEASKIGGSQVYLKEKEVFSIEDLLYALMIQSANDAAVALAVHIAGSKNGFIEMMNKRAKEIGMKNTIINSVHGLPPGKGQKPDFSSPRDIAKLCFELVKHKETLKYTSIQEKNFRAEPEKIFIMRNHNHLLHEFEGCDGLKTGYYLIAGYSIAATAQKNGLRTIAVVMGSQTRKMRDEKTKELLSKGFVELTKIYGSKIISSAKNTGTSTDISAGTNTSIETAAVENDTIQISRKKIKIFAASVIAIIILFLIASYRKKPKRYKF